MHVETADVYEALVLAAVGANVLHSFLWLPLDTRRFRERLTESSHRRDCKKGPRVNFSIQAARFVACARPQSARPTGSSHCGYALLEGEQARAIRQRPGRVPSRTRSASRRRVACDRHLQPCGSRRGSGSLAIAAALAHRASRPPIPLGHCNRGNEPADRAALGGFGGDRLRPACTARKQSDVPTRPAIARLESSASSEVRAWARPERAGLMSGAPVSTETRCRGAVASLNSLSPYDLRIQSGHFCAGTSQPV